MRRLITAVAAALIGLVLLPPRADACSCVGGVPLCQSLWTTDAVFSARVIDIAEVPAKDSPYMNRRVTLRVLDTWRGSVEPVVDVTTGVGGGDCGYPFDKGTDYLVFASANAAGALSTGICSRTRPLARASEDIDYLKQVRSRPSAAGRIFGRVQYQRHADAPPGIQGDPIAGYTITLTQGDRSRKTTTAADGSYVFEDVAAGRYVVTLDLPSTEDAGGPTETTLADPRGCAAMDFYVALNGRIRVRLVDDQGRPRPGLRPELLNLDADPDKPAAWSRGFVESDKQGWIEFVHLPPGRYMLALNEQVPPTSKSPYPTSYFPGVAAREDATTITLGPGERVEPGGWVLPARLPEQLVTGTVRWADGRPAVRAHVIVKGSKHGGWRYSSMVDVSATTDAEGRFSVTLLDGVPYELFAYGEVGEQRTQVRTAPIELVPSAAMPPLRLVIPH